MTPQEAQEFVGLAKAVARLIMALEQTEQERDRIAAELAEVKAATAENRTAPVESVRHDARSVG